MKMRESGRGIHPETAEKDTARLTEIIKREGIRKGSKVDLLIDRQEFRDVMDVDVGQQWQSGFVFKELGNGILRYEHPNYDGAAGVRTSSILNIRRTPE